MVRQLKWGQININPHNVDLTPFKVPFRTAPVGMQRGVTLVELMVVLAIVGLLALVATPLTSSWGTSADLHTAAGQIDQAHAHARALALRNAEGAVGADPAARIVYDASYRELRVCRQPSGPCAQPVWRGVLPSGVQLTVLNGDFPVLLTNRGHLPSPLSVQLTKGEMSDVLVLQ